MKKSIIILFVFVFCFMITVSYAAPKSVFEPHSDGHICTCGYVYLSWVGDEANGIPAGTKFEDLPADWVCPICGCSYHDFQLIPSEADNVTKQNSSKANDQSKPNLFPKE